MIIRNDFRAISLPELLERASMLTRVDRKYCLHADEVERAVRNLDPATQALEIGGSRLLNYRSVYFDTADFRSYFDAAHHRRIRSKVRQRWYLDTDTAFTEVKQAGPRGNTIKTRRPAHEIGRLSTPHARWIAETTGAQNLTAVIWNSYRRTTLLLPDGSGRATIDTDLAWWDDAGGSLVLSDLVIIETKTHRGNSVFDRELWRCGHRPLRISKFGAGMAALHPEFPRHRWNRTMRRFFQPTISAAT